MVWGNNLMASADSISLKYSLPWMVRIFITVLQPFLVLKRSHAAEGVEVFAVGSSLLKPDSANSTQVLCLTNTSVD